MTTTAQAAPKVVGGYSPTPDKLNSTTIKDHDDGDVTLVWYSDPWCSSGKLPPFPIQVYVTANAVNTANDPGFPAAFLYLFQELDLDLSSSDRCCHHFEIYAVPQANYLACVGHQKKEGDWRYRNGIWPQLVQASSPEEGYHGFIVVIDSDDWATEGIVFVRFDPAEYKSPEDFGGWYLAGPHGDIDTVYAAKVDAVSLTAFLLDWFEDAGDEWRLPDWNNGGCRPAIDSAAHVYVESEDVEYESIKYEDEGTETLPAAALTAEESEVRNDGHPRIIDSFREDHLWILPGPLNERFRTETYEDSVGHHTISVWDSMRTSLRPGFSVTLYCGANAIHAAEALFGCLNKGLIADEGWALDVKRGFGTIDHALTHHDRETRRRTPAELGRRRKCMQMLSRKVAQDRLPDELLECIEDLLVPAPISNYASLPNRQFRNFFLYLNPDASKPVSQGPLLVYSNPVPKAHDAHQVMPQEGALDSISTFQDDVLRVRNLRFWHRVADELHIIWSFCSAQSEASLPAEFPKVSLDLRIPNNLSFSSIWNTEQSLTFALILDFDAPITVNTYAILSSRTWHEALEVIDCTTDRTCVPMPLWYSSRDALDCSNSWAFTSKLGLPYAGHSAEHSPLRTLEPHKRTVISLPLFPADMRFWEAFERENLLVEGHEYVFRLKHDVTIPRWTFGKIGALKGPYNLPPLPVSLEKEIHFTYKASTPTDLIT